MTYVLQALQCSSQAIMPCFTPGDMSMTRLIFEESKRHKCALFLLLCTDGAFQIFKIIKKSTQCTSAVLNKHPLYESHIYSS